MPEAAAPTVVPIAGTLDTVSVATEDPHREQPWSELGLKADEYARIREILGRRPTSSELAMYSVMWSEHCSYKSSKVHLKQFSEIPQETPVGKMLAGIGENAGVIDIGQGYAVTFKIESHNHPSYVEPYQGAATGVGGIVRDGFGDLAAYAALRGFPIIPCDLCGSQAELQRKRVKAMLREWERSHPGRLESIFGALASVAPSHRRLPLMVASVSSASPWIFARDRSRSPMISIRSADSAGVGRSVDLGGVTCERRSNRLPRTRAPSRRTGRGLVVRSRLMSASARRRAASMPGKWLPAR